VVEYETAVFSESFEEQHTEYQGLPDDTKDKLWKNLYSSMGAEFWSGFVFLHVLGLTPLAVPYESSALFANATERIPWEPFQGDLLTGLSVSHQLHCLNRLRQSLWPERYNSSIWKVDGSFDYMKFGHLGRYSLPLQINTDQQLTS
jgi:hypothetical protein